MKKSFKLNKAIIYSFILLAIFIIPITCFSHPIYVINPTIDKTILNPNEPIEIQMRIAGEGTISENRLLIYSDKNVSLKGEQIEVESGFLVKHFDKELFNTKIEAAGFMFPQSEIGIVKEMVSDKDDSLKRYDIEPIYIAKAIPRTVGDHVLTFVFIYSGDGNQYFVDKKEIKFHVRTNFERYQIWIYALIILIAILALFLAGAYNEEIKFFIRNLFRKKK